MFPVLAHRISTARKEKAGSRLVFSLIEPNWPLQYVQYYAKYKGWGMTDQRAGLPIAVDAQVQCQEPKTGQQKVQFFCEDD